MKAMSKTIIAMTTVAFLALILVTQSVAQESIECESDYTVQAGDWLAKIADEHYGDYALYPAIVLATNAQSASDESYATIADPWLIEPDWKLCLPSTQAAQSGLTVDTLKNAEYQSEWTASGKAPLVDGEYQESIVPGAATKIVVLLSGRMAFGYTSDGQPLAIVILITNPGGSGTFYDLAAVVEQDGEPVNVATTFLGDRAQIQSLAILSGQIALEMVTHGPDDPMCCPTQRVRNTYVLEGDTLVEVSSEVMGAADEIQAELTLDALRNATYASEWEDSGFITLTDGLYEGEPYVEGGASRLVVTLISPLAFGDLDGDGVDDAAVILVANPGGSGTFYSLEAVRNEGGEPVHLASYALGDRAKIRSLAIQDGQIALEMVTHGPDDPMCCPTQIVRNTYALENGALVERESEAIGKVEGPSEMAAPSELMGQMWYWQSYLDTAGLNNIQVDDPAQYTLIFLPDGTYWISADCNSGTGGYSVEGSSLTLEPGPITLVACGPESLDAQYLAKLGDVVSFVLEDGKLFLNLKMDAGNLVFGKDATPATASLEGTIWKLDSYLNSQGELVGVLPDTAITAEFQAGQVTGSAGCNSYFGSYESSGDRLTFGVIGMTEMYCMPEALMTQEGEVLAALESAAAYRFVDGALQIANADGETVLIFSVLEPAPLTGTTWQLTGYNNGQGGFVSVLSGTEITALFGDDGSLTGSAGCNDYTTSYVIDGDAVTLGPVATTRKMCAEPEGIMDQESAYLAALESATAYQIKGNALKLTDADGVQVATFTASDPEAAAASGLVGEIWQWVGTQTPTEVITVDDPNKYTLEFLPDGEVHVQADCNVAGGTYTISGSHIKIAITTTTLAACPPESLGDEFIKELNEAVIYLFEDDDLLIDRIYDSGTMRFARGG
jgi:heat shock protein HslJ